MCKESEASTDFKDKAGNLLANTQLSKEAASEACRCFCMLERALGIRLPTLMGAAVIRNHPRMSPDSFFPGPVPVSLGCIFLARYLD